MGLCRRLRNDPVLGKKRKLKYYYHLQVKFFQICYQQNGSFSLVYYEQELKFLNTKVYIQGWAGLSREVSSWLRIQVYHPDGQITEAGTQDDLLH